MIDIDYGDVIKSIFDQRKKPINKIYKNNRNSPSLKSITSLPSEENMGTTVKGSIKGNKKEEVNHDDFEELKIINLDYIKNNEEENRLSNKFNNNQIDLNGNVLLSKIQNTNLKVTKDDHFEFNISNTNFENEQSNDNNQLKQAKNFPQTYSNQNIKDIKNILFHNNLYNKSNSNIVQTEFQKQNKKSFRNQKIKKIKDEGELNKNITNKFNKYEQYNTEALAYEAIKNYSHCKPGKKEKNFLQRMEFYSVKKQTEEKIIDLMVNKAVRKIPEKEKLIIFNRLIEDSNRRAEAKNRIQLFNQKNQLLNNFDNHDSTIRRKKVKFDQRKFEENYQEKIINKLQEKERNLELLRRQKIKEEKDKEDKIIKEMKQRYRKATQNEIDSISKRLYNEANNRKLKREMLRSFSELERRLNTISDINKCTRNYSSFFSQYQIKSFDKLNYSKNYNNYSFNNNNISINSNEFSPIQNYSESYKQKIINKMKKNNSNYNDISHSLYRNMKYYSYNNKQYIPYYNAEKVIDEFFLK